MDIVIGLAIAAGCAALMVLPLWVLARLNNAADRESFDQTYRRRGAIVVRAIGGLFRRRG